MTLPDSGAAALFRAVDLQPDGPAIVGRPMRANGRGVYVIELPTTLGSPPVDLVRVGQWLERVPTLRLDGERPTPKGLAARLAAFWLPSQRVVFIGAAETSVAGRIAALDKHVLGDRRPHAASHWLKTLRVEALRVWWAMTDATEEAEDALLSAFAESVPEAEAAALPDRSVVLPWANLRTATGEPKRHGISGSVPPAEPAPPPPPPTRVVDVPAADADGARMEPRGTGSTRRAPVTPPPSRRATPSPAAARRTGADAARPARASRSKPSGRPADPVLLSADGLDRLETELADLVARRPEIVGRIRAAKELGDLKENSDYTAAREEQGFLEGRIQAIEAHLRAAVIVEAATGDRVMLGSTVLVEMDGEERRFTIVGTTEANAAAGRISHQSPIGRALIGRVAGEVAVAQTPGGELRVRVVAVE